MLHRQINWSELINSYRNFNFRVERFPIKDFSRDELIAKLKPASDILHELISDGKEVYVHCTAGMNRAAAIVITYIVFSDSLSLEEAYEYVRSYREIICPDINDISQVIKKEISYI